MVLAGTRPAADRRHQREGVPPAIEALAVDEERRCGAGRVGVTRKDVLDMGDRHSALGVMGTTCVASIAGRNDSVASARVFANQS